MRGLPAIIAISVALFGSGSGLHAQTTTWTLDASHAPFLVLETPAARNVTLVPTPEGGLLAHGGFTHVDGAVLGHLARLRPDGAVDPTFSIESAVLDSILSFAPLSADRLLVVRKRPDSTDTSLGELIRLQSDGTIDFTYPALAITGSVLRFFPLPDGSVLALGHFSAVGSTTRNGIARFAADGTFDAGFAPALGSRAIFFSAFAADHDGGIVLSARTTREDSRLLNVFVRLRPDGSTDASFAPASISGSYRALAVQPDGKIVVAGEPSLIHAMEPPGVISISAGNLFRLLPTGEHDVTFTPNMPGTVERVASIPNGRLVAEVALASAGMLSTAPAHRSVFVLGRDGNVERDARSLVEPTDDVYLLGVQPDGRVLIRHGPPTIGHRMEAVSIVFSPRMTPTFLPAPTIGSAANDFESSTIIPHITTTVAATLVRANLARFHPDGNTAESIATRFTTRATTHFARLAADSSGRVVAAGNFTEIDGQSRPGVARFHASGDLDVSFAPAAGFDPWNRTLEFVAPDGAVILREAALGSRDSDGFYRHAWRIVRLLPDGREDANFTPAVEMKSRHARWHAMAADGAMLVSLFEPDNRERENLKLAWLDAFGRRTHTLPASIVDTRGYAYVGFFPGYSNPITQAGLLPDGRIFLAGTFTQVNDTAQTAVARLRSDGTSDPTFMPDSVGWGSDVRIRRLANGQIAVTSMDDLRRDNTTLLRRLLADGSRDPTFPLLVLDGQRPVALTADGVPDLNWPVNARATDANDMSGSVFAGDGSLWTHTGMRSVPTEIEDITVQPESRTSIAGRTIHFQVATGTTKDASYQWYFNDEPIAGARRPVLALPLVATEHAGSYVARVTIGGKTFTSAAATLQVTPNTSRIINFSGLGRVAPGAPQVAGLVARANAARPVLMRAVGRGIPWSSGIGGPLLDPAIALYEIASPNRPLLLAENRGGASAPSIVALAAQVGAFPLVNRPPFAPADSLGAVLGPAIGGGVFIVEAKSGDGSTGMCLLEIYDSSAEPAPLLVRNVSVRATTGTGGNVLTAGWVIRGNGPLRLLVRGIGAILADFGIDGAIGDARLTLYKAGRSMPIAANDDWQSDPELADAARAAGAFALPTGSRDAAVLLTLEPGAYTAQLSTSTAGDEGEGMIEIYVLDPK